MRMKLLFALTLIVALRWEAESAHAQTPTDVAIRANAAVVRFPEEVMFTLAFDPAVPVTAATLRYHVEKFSCVDVRTEASATVVAGQASWTWEMIRSGNPPPGSVVSWEWALTLADGSAYTTPAQRVTLTDDRFDWQTRSAEYVTVHWYAGDDVGPVLLDSAESTLQRLEQQMGIQLQTDVTFYIYGSAEDMRDAVLYLQDWAGGVAFSEYNTILLGVPPRSLNDYGVRTVAHELTHLVVGQFGRSCVGGSRPTWLEEGLAGVAEGEPDARVQNDLDRALADDSFLPLRSLSGEFSAHDSAASLAYSQSYSVVRYLLDTNGQAPLQALILALADGATYDDALQQAYNLNTDSLETAWRAAIGAPPRAIPPTPTPLRAETIPTAPPLAGLVSVPTPATYAPAPDAPAPARSVCGISFAPLAIGLWLARRRRQALPQSFPGGDR